MSLKVYFCGSMTIGRDDVTLYSRLITEMQRYCTVLTEHVGYDSEQLAIAEKDMTDKEIHDRDLEWLANSDAVIAEVTQPSLGVGYEIAKAADMGKPILCLFRPESGKKLTPMISGAAKYGLFVIKYYKENEFPDILKQFFANLPKQ